MIWLFQHLIPYQTSTNNSPTSYFFELHWYLGFIWDEYTKYIYHCLFNQVKYMTSQRIVKIKSVWILLYDTGLNMVLQISNYTDKS